MMLRNVTLLSTVSLVFSRVYYDVLATCLGYPLDLLLAPIPLQLQMVSLDLNLACIFTFCIEQTYLYIFFHLFHLIYTVS